VKAGPSTHVADNPYPSVSGLSLRRRQGTMRGSLQNRLLCLIIEHKLEISTVLQTILPYNITSQQPSGQRAIWRYLQGNRGVCHCVNPLASHQSLRFPNPARRTTIKGLCAAYILVTCIQTEVPNMQTNALTRLIIQHPSTPRPDPPRFITTHLIRSLG
jgi:hypothetical protein